MSEVPVARLSLVDKGGKQLPLKLFLFWKNKDGNSLSHSLSQLSHSLQRLFILVLRLSARVILQFFWHGCCQLNIQEAIAIHKCACVCVRARVIERESERVPNVGII